MFTYTTIAGLGPIYMPDHRAQRTQRGWWEAARLHSMRTMLQPGDRVLDVGTEEGDLSALIASWGCGIFLIEPNPKAWPWIAAIFDRNEIKQRVHGCYVGLVGSNGQAEASAKTTDFSYKEYLADLDWPECAHQDGVPDHGFYHLAEHMPVSPVVTIDALLPLVGFVPNAITMDIEGGELHAMRGAYLTLQEHRPKVWISVHDQFLRETYHQSAAELHDFMRSFDYDPVFLATDHEEHWMYLPKEYGWRY